ncbi:MAG: hypothetical protein K0R57_34 [Paenibacillaceae bacterium]|nr:hypothetical protein [Paenibacillaceae bacterium]
MPTPGYPWVRIWKPDRPGPLRAVNRTAADQEPVQYAEVYNDKVYDLGARVKPGAGTDTVKLMLSFLVNGEVRVREVAAGSAAVSGWTELSGQYEVNEGGDIDSAADTIVPRLSNRL